MIAMQSRASDLQRADCCLRSRWSERAKDSDGLMMSLSHLWVEPCPPKEEPPMRIEKLRTLARELAGEACDYERREL